MKINFSLTGKQLVEFKRIVESNELLFNQNEIFKLCKPASYMIYYLKEINEYVNKLVEGDLEKINLAKKLRREYQHLSKEDVNYSKFI
jgi:hypothetical protein